MNNPRKILLVDDVALFLEMEKSFFHRENFELLVAYNGLEALEMTLELRPALVFMNLFMPEMNGDECCRLIKGNPLTQGTPVIMVTQSDREEDLQRCRSAGCDDILLKPISPTMFMATAAKYLQVAERQAPRVEARVRIRYGINDCEVLSDYSVNLSSGGMFLEAAEPLPQDTPLSLSFELPNAGRTIYCRGRVAWVNHPERRLKPQLPAGVGVQFLDLTLVDMDALRDFVQKQTVVPAW